MTQSLITVVLFIVVIACLPFAVKWIKQQTGGQLGGLVSQAKFISAVSVGPNQRVVTVEIGPEGKRVWLTVGVTPQAITCLHTSAIDQKSGAAASIAATLTPSTQVEPHA
jgi:flagellar protein FliO/FliZ